jgi:hypothetical protein
LFKDIFACFGGELFQGKVEEFGRETRPDISMSSGWRYGIIIYPVVDAKVAFMPSLH